MADIHGAREKGNGSERTMEASAAKAERKQMTAANNTDVWKNTIWGSRESFVRDRMESEGYSAEAAEKFAAIWERAEHRLQENSPEILRSE